MANVTVATSCRNTVTKIRACMVDSPEIGIAVGSRGCRLSGKDESVRCCFSEKKVQY